MNYWKRGMSCAMAALLAAGLFAGCGNQNETPEGGDTPNGTTVDEYVYVPQYIPIKGELNGYVGNVAYANGALYATSWGVIGTELVEVSEWGEVWDAAVPLDDVTDETPEGEPEMIEREIYGQTLHKI